MRRRSWCSDRTAALLVAAALAWSCKSSDPAPAHDAGAPAGSASAPAAAVASVASEAASAAAAASARAGLSGMDAGAAADAGSDYAGGECPDFDPEHWSPYQAFPKESACWFFTPSSKEKLPRPLAWEPCGRDDFGAGCRRLALPRGEKLSFAGSASDYRAVRAPPKGPPRIQVALECARQRSLVYIAAEVDGPLVGALAVDPEWDCRFDPILTPAGWGADVRYFDPPRVPDDTGFTPDRVSRSLRGARGQLVPQKLGEALPVEDPARLARWSKSPLPPAAMTALGLSPGIGPRRNLFAATDGTDVVWTSNNWEATCGVLTGRYVEDPAAAVATRVVELRCKEMTADWVLGCGWAANTTDEGLAVLVHLQDGKVHRFPKLSGPLDRGPAAATIPLAISCREAFFAVGGPSPTIHRVPLASLPPAVAPPEPPRPLIVTDAGAAVTAPPPVDGGTPAAGDAGG